MKEQVQSSRADSDTHPGVLGAIIKASDSYSIIASQDIVDVRGLKLWAKGQRVSNALQQRLLDRKLLRPLEACLAVEDGVTVFSLHADLKDYLDSDTPLTQALRPYAPVLLQKAKQLPLHSVAQLLLTVGLATRPATLPHAIRAMALAGAMAGRPDSPVEVRLAMLGGLLHDIGEMYIQPEYLDLEGSLDLIGHKHLVVHPRVAQMLLSAITDYPDALCRAIGEHHERLDGSGYPARLTDAAISPLGRLLAVVEVTEGILVNPQAPLTRADFALRVVPGEFDPYWTGFISNIARSANESISLSTTPRVFNNTAPPQQLDQRSEQIQLLAAFLKNQGRIGEIVQLVDTALRRIERLRVAWNAMGYWGVDDAELEVSEIFQRELVDHELLRRLRELTRECLLMSERLGELEKTWVEPLWLEVLVEA